MAFSALRHASFRLKMMLGIPSTKSILLFKREGQKVYLWAPSHGRLCHDVLFSRLFHPKRLRRMRRMLRENPLDCEKLNLVPIISPQSRLPIGYILDGDWLANNNVASGETPGLVPHGPVTALSGSTLPAHPGLELIIEEDEEATVVAESKSSSLWSQSASNTSDPTISSDEEKHNTASEGYDSAPSDEPQTPLVFLADDDLPDLFYLEKDEVSVRQVASFEEEESEQSAGTLAIPAVSKSLSSVRERVKLFEQLANAEFEELSTRSSQGFTGQTVAKTCLAFEEAILAENSLKPEPVPRTGSMWSSNGLSTVHSGPLTVFGKRLNFTVTFEAPPTEVTAGGRTSTTPVVEALDCDTSLLADLGVLLVRNWHKWLVPLLGLSKFSGLEIILVFIVLIIACTGRDEISSLEAAPEREVALPSLPVSVCDDLTRNLAEPATTAILNESTNETTDSNPPTATLLTPELSEFLVSRLKWHGNDIPRFVRALGSYSDSSLRSGFFRATGTPAISDDLCAQIVEDCRQWAPLECEQVLREMEQVKRQRESELFGNTLAPSEARSLSGSTVVATSPFAVRLERDDLFSLKVDGNHKTGSKWRVYLRDKLHKPFLKS